MGGNPNNPEPAFTLILTEKQMRALDGMSPEKKLAFEAKEFVRQMHAAKVTLPASQGMSETDVATSILQAGMVRVVSQAQQQRNMQDFGAKMGELARSGTPQARDSMLQATTNMISGNYPGAEAPLKTEQAFLDNLRDDYRAHGHGEISGVQQAALDALQREFSRPGESSLADIQRVMGQAAALYLLKEKAQEIHDPDQLKKFSALLKSNEDLREVVKKLGPQARQEMLRDDQEIDLPQVKNLAEKSQLGRK